MNLRDELWRAFVAGFEASGEGWNGEQRPDLVADVRSDPDLREKFKRYLAEEGL